MIIVLNRGAGSVRSDTPAIITELLRSHGITPLLLVARNGDEISDLAKQAAQSDDKEIVGAGGDGTIDSIAAALVGTGKTLGVLPLGTFNMFANRMNIPLSL